MREIYFVLLLCVDWACSLVATRPQKEAALRKERIQASQAIANQLVGHLMNELGTAMRLKSPAEAVEKCNLISPEAEAHYRETTPGLTGLRRIGTRTRNTEKHTPTTVEAAWLAEIEPTITDDTAPPTGVIESEDSQTILLPIVIKNAMCLTCHGNPAEFDEDLKAKLAELYPADQATGYKLGDLRGAVAISWEK